jgi:hypothetical protein
LLLQLTDNGRQVDKFRLHWHHFGFDLVHLPRETLRAAVRTNPYGFSAAQTGQFLQRGRSMASISDAVSFGLSPTIAFPPASGFRALSRASFRGHGALG